MLLPAEVSFGNTRFRTRDRSIGRFLALVELLEKALSGLRSGETVLRDVLLGCRRVRQLSHRTVPAEGRALASE